MRIRVLFLLGLNVVAGTFTLMKTNRFFGTVCYNTFTTPHRVTKGDLQNVWVQRVLEQNHAQNLIIISLGRQQQ